MNTSAWKSPGPSGGTAEQETNALSDHQQRLISTKWKGQTAGETSEAYQHEMGQGNPVVSRFLLMDVSGPWCVYH